MTIGDLLVISLVALLVIKPQDIPGIIKSIKHYKSLFKKNYNDILTQSGLIDLAKPYDKSNTDFEQMNKYLKKIQELDELYIGDYNLQDIQSYYVKLVENKNYIQAPLINTTMFPSTRLRRNRLSDNIRDLVAETSLKASDLIYPMFIVEGNNIRAPIKGFFNICRLSIDELVKEVLVIEKLGIKAIVLFPVIEKNLKSAEAFESYREDNLICRAIKTLKDKGIKLSIIADVALDPYTTHGHDGIVINNYVDNDETIKILNLQALSLAKAGVDILAPSDMMDGRIASIRNFIDEQGFKNTLLMSYAVKYASNFYSSFREAVGSDLKGFDKKTYQMDFRNKKEALREIELDVEEGADICIIKPALLCLDIINEATQKFNIPIFAYQVSSEYSIMKAAASQKIINFEACMIEALTSIKRAGVRSIITYAAIEVANILN